MLHWCKGYRGIGFIHFAIELKELDSQNIYWNKVWQPNLTRNNPHSKILICHLALSSSTTSMNLYNVPTDSLWREKKKKDLDSDLKLPHKSFKTEQKGDVSAISAGCGGPAMGKPVSFYTHNFLCRKKSVMRFVADLGKLQETGDSHLYKWRLLPQ